MKGDAITTIALGKVASAAVIVFLAGKTRYCTPHTYFLIHKIASPQIKAEVISQNQFNNVLDGLKMDEVIKQDILDKEIKLSRLDKANIEKEKVLILTAEQAKKKGLVHEIKSLS